MRRPLRAYEWVALALITAGAAALRLIHIGQVLPDPFYDAAVRSMGLSWHNFFFGAYEPAASVSIDKPPVDLWLQVASVKLFGFSPTALKLPEVLAGILAVPLLFLAVRRMWSSTAGLAAALAMAVLPAEVITARSDTMDGVMMALIVLALLLILRACQTGGVRWLLAGAAVMGIAFDVKILESFVALPGLVLLAYLALPDPRRARLLKLALAGVVYVVVALAWLTGTLLFPAHDRPWAIGSSNGSAWNAVFVFNGSERLSGSSPEPQPSAYQPGRHYPVATQAERDAIPILPPSPTRLLARVGPLSGQRLGIELLAALLLGIPALLWGVWQGADTRSRREADDQRADRDRRALDASDATGHGANDATGHAPGGPTRHDGSREAQTENDARSEQRERRLRRGVAAGLGLWLMTGIVLFSHMARLHPRYVEGMLPAIAGVLGIGATWASTPRERMRVAVLVIALAVLVLYGERLLYGTPVQWWISLASAVGAIACALLARLPTVPVRLRSALAPGGVLVLTLCTVLAIPFGSDITAIEDHVSDAGYVGALPAEEQRLLSDYLRAHQGTARYEVAAQSATQIASLIVQDVRPILILNSYGPRVFTNVAELKRLIAAGKVRYAFLNFACPRHAAPNNPSCSAPAQWIRAHGTDVSRSAGLPHGRVLWRLPGVAS